jgi:threonine dehydrogenase-like Zn-dependent dehydrogenase
VLSYGGVGVEDVRDLVYGAMFTRGGDELKNSAVFIGGSDVPTGEAMLKAALDSFFGPVRLSVMMDSNGCNTTAIAAVIRVVTATDVKGKKSVVFAGTGPVGMRGAALLAKEGSEVYITSRRMERSEATARLIKERFDVGVTPVEVKDEAGTAKVLAGAHVVFTAGAAGVEMVPEALWKDNPTLQVLADVNAVPPLGIGGIKATDKGKERSGKIAFGALGIGGLKMKIHRGCVARLFESNELVLEAEQIYALAKTMSNE